MEKKKEGGVKNRIIGNGEVGEITYIVNNFASDSDSQLTFPNIDIPPRKCQDPIMSIFVIIRRVTAGQMFIWMQWRVDGNKVYCQLFLPQHLFRVCQLILAFLFITLRFPWQLSAHYHLKSIFCSIQSAAAKRPVISAQLSWPTFKRTQIERLRSKTKHWIFAQYEGLEK